jgi:hypothetical protein
MNFWQREAMLRCLRPCTYPLCFGFGVVVRERSRFGAGQRGRLVACMMPDVGTKRHDDRRVRRNNKEEK